MEDVSIHHPLLDETYAVPCLLAYSSYYYKHRRHGTVIYKRYHCTTAIKKKGKRNILWQSCLHSDAYKGNIVWWYYLWKQLEFLWQLMAETVEQEERIIILSRRLFLLFYHIHRGYSSYEHKQESLRDLLHQWWLAWYFLYIYRRDRVHSSLHSRNNIRKKMNTLHKSHNQDSTGSCSGRRRP